MTIISEYVRCQTYEVEIEIGNNMPSICDICHESVNIGMSVEVDDSNDYNRILTEVVICKSCLNNIVGRMNQL